MGVDAWSECFQQNKSSWNSLDYERRVRSVDDTTGKLVDRTVQMMGSSSEWMDGPVSSSRVELSNTNYWRTIRGHDAPASGEHSCNALAYSMFRKLRPYQLAPGSVRHA